MIKKIVIAAVVVLGALLIYAATQPDTFRIQRAASIKAPPERIFAVLNDFMRWESWSPWEKKDPAMKRTFSAVTSGKGAVYAWEGNRDVGQGRILIRQKVSQSDVAAMAGIARENVSRILNDWIRDKLVSRLSGYYCLENKKKLQRESAI